MFCLKYVVRGRIQLGCALREKMLMLPTLFYVFFCVKVLSIFSLHSVCCKRLAAWLRPLNISTNTPCFFHGKVSLCSKIICFGVLEANGVFGDACTGGIEIFEDIFWGLPLISGQFPLQWSMDMRCQWCRVRTYLCVLGHHQRNTAGSIRHEQTNILPKGQKKLLYHLTNRMLQQTNRKGRNDMKEQHLKDFCNSSSAPTKLVPGSLQRLSCFLTIVS